MLVILSFIHVLVDLLLCRLFLKTIIWLVSHISRITGFLTEGIAINTTHGK